MRRGAAQMTFTRKIPGRPPRAPMPYLATVLPRMRSPGAVVILEKNSTLLVTWQTRDNRLVLSPCNSALFFQSPHVFSSDPGWPTDLLPPVPAPPSRCQPLLGHPSPVGGAHVCTLPCPHNPLWTRTFGHPRGWRRRPCVWVVNEPGSGWSSVCVQTKQNEPWPGLLSG